MTNLLSYSAAAKLLGISEVSIKRYVRDGLLPIVRFSSRMVRIPQDRLEILIESGGINARKGA